MPKKTPPTAKAAPAKDTAGAAQGPAPGAESLADLTTPPVVRRVFDAIMHHAGEGIDPKDLEALADTDGPNEKLSAAIATASAESLINAFIQTIAEILCVCAVVDHMGEVISESQLRVAKGYLSRAGKILSRLLAAGNPEFMAALGRMQVDTVALNRATAALADDPWDADARKEVQRTLELFKRVKDWARPKAAPAATTPAELEIPQPEGIGTAVHQKLKEALQAIPLGEWFSASRLGEPADRTVIFRWVTAVCDGGLLESNGAAGRGRQYRRLK